MNSLMRHGLVLLIALLLAVGGISQASAADDGDIYVVKPSDRLVDIAQVHKVSIYDLIRANHISDPALITVGQRLVIPSTSAALAPSAAPGLGDASLPSATADKTLIPAVTESPSMSPPEVLSDATTAPQAPPAQWVTRSSAAQTGDQLGKVVDHNPLFLDALVSVDNLIGLDLTRVAQQLTIPGEAAIKNGLAAPRRISVKKIVVSVSRQRVQAYQGSRLLWNWPASTGRRGSPTQTGRFMIQDKMPSAYGSTWGIDMPYWMGIYYSGSLENGFHGLPVSRKTKAKVWSGLVGTPITFGCVMLSDANIRQLYAWADIGTLVVINP